MTVVDCVSSLRHVSGQRIFGREWHSKRKGSVFLWKGIADQGNEKKDPYEMVDDFPVV